MLTAQIEPDGSLVLVANEREPKRKQISLSQQVETENGCDNTLLPETHNPPSTVTLRNQKKKARMMLDSEPNESTLSLTLAARLEAIEAQLQQIAALRVETLSRIAGVADELVSTLPVLTQPETGTTTASSVATTSSGLARILERFNQLRRDFEQRRRVAQERLACQRDYWQRNFESQVQAAQGEAEDDQAETIVAIIHKQRSVVSATVTTLAPSALSSVRPSLRSSKEDSSLETPSKPSLRKRALSAASPGSKASTSASGALQRQGPTSLRYQTLPTDPLRSLKTSAFEEDMAFIKSQLK